MSIELTPEHERLIHQAIQSGAYRDPNEVIGAALKKLADGLPDENGPPRKSRLWELREAEPRRYLDPRPD